MKIEEKIKHIVGHNYYYLHLTNKEWNYIYCEHSEHDSETDCENCGIEIYDCQRNAHLEALLKKYTHYGISRYNMTQEESEEAFLKEFKDFFEMLHILEKATSIPFYDDNGFNTQSNYEIKIRVNVSDIGLISFYVLLSHRYVKKDPLKIRISNHKPGFENESQIFFTNKEYNFRKIKIIKEYFFGEYDFYKQKSQKITFHKEEESIKRTV